MEQKKKRENIAAGIVGAFLGTLLGVVCIVIIDQMGYVASVSGFVMAICALKGYELLGGTLSKKGAVISSVLVLAMTYLTHRLTWAIAIASSLETGILEAYRAIPYLLEADMLEAGGGPASPQWFFYLEPENRRLDVVDGMEPVELTPEVVGMVDGDGGAWLIRFEIWEKNG